MSICTCKKEGILCEVCETKAFVLSRELDKIEVSSPKLTEEEKASLPF